MKSEGIWFKIWQILYPVLLYFLLDLLLVWAVQYLMSPRTAEGQMILEPYSAAVASIVFLAVSAAVMYAIYRKDYHPKATWIYRHPLYFLLIAAIGILASHGLSALVSLLNVDQIAGNYTEIEQTVFMAPWPLVILQVVLLTPLSEELLFRGLLYKRIEQFTGNFWIASLVSAAVFGIAHWNLAQGIFAFFFGMLSCAVYDKVKNLWACVALHAGGNLISVILVYTGLAYPAEWMYVAGMVVTLAGAWALYHFRIRPLDSETEKEAA